MKKNRFLLSAAVVLLLTTCVKPPEYSIIPHIEVLSINQNDFDELDPTPLIVKIYFEDGDGDIGSDDSINMFWEDSRIPGYPQIFKIPFIPSEGNSKAISGTITVNYPITFCLDSLAIDTFYYRITIEDRAGHISNMDSTDNIYLHCN